MANFAREQHGRFEQDDRWTAVDNYAIQHLVHEEYESALQYAIDLSAKEGLPNIEVSPLQGRFLKLQCMALNAKNILEVGTLGGYSSILLASSSPDAKVTTIEISPKHKAVAEEVHKRAGLSDRIEILLGAGMEVLPQLRKDVKDGKRENFGFVFIDADKENNLNYLNEVIPMCRPRALIIVDNVVRKGTLADPEAAERESKVAGARRVVEGAGRDARLECSLLQTVGEKNYDGFLLCVVK
ncbi:hypothetical protein LTR36_010160 [Oleoguttula mirabilis]|uniref:O-methyltransferase n=1 Tax=Oleoguttula mirabilis TaxID=1507867 RepID=A0AAV9JS50_9PEZI|nr:hypothetical protein LTR36_010160 [Oleoguttula mirabilis]